MIQKLNTDNGLQVRWTKTTCYNTGLAKVAVRSSAETFVVKFTTFAKPVNVVGSVFLFLVLEVSFRQWCFLFC